MNLTYALIRAWPDSQLQLYRCTAFNITRHTRALFGHAVHPCSIVLVPMLQDESLENQQLMEMPSSQQGIMTPRLICGFFHHFFDI